MERFFGSLKSEWVHDGCYRSTEQDKLEINHYILVTTMEQDRIVIILVCY
jgi:hypothetical protein